VFVGIPYSSEQGILKREQGVILLEQGISFEQQGTLSAIGSSDPQLLPIDRLLWPRCLGAMALVKPATVIQLPSRISALLALALTVRTTIGRSRSS
jgi:hypothetical protein